jgi:hypothetical protein
MQPDHPQEGAGAAEATAAAAERDPGAQGDAAAGGAPAAVEAEASESTGKRQRPLTARGRIEGAGDVEAGSDIGSSGGGEGGGGGGSAPDVFRGFQIIDAAGVATRGDPRTARSEGARTPVAPGGGARARFAGPPLQLGLLAAGGARTRAWTPLSARTRTPPRPPSARSSAAHDARSTPGPGSYNLFNLHEKGGRPGHVARAPALRPGATFGTGEKLGATPREREAAASPGPGQYLVRPSPIPPPLVLIGHAASLTPY